MGNIRKIKNKNEPKFKSGDIVKYTTEKGDVFYGKVAYVIKSETIAYGVLMEHDLQLYHFPECRLEKE